MVPPPSAPPSAVTSAASVAELSHADATSDAMRVLRPRRAAPADAVRPTRAEVNLGHLRHNLRAVRQRVQQGLAQSGPEASEPPRVWGVLKADGYGHGAPAVARTLERAGIDGLCVALLEEAVELREAGIQRPILLMGGYFGVRRDGIEEMLARNVTPVVYEPSHVERIAAVARDAGRRVAVHLKIDTGMARLGVRPSELEGMLEALERSPEVRVDGLMTHLACADAPDPEPSLEQLRRFAEVRARLAARGVRPRVVHAANSAAAIALPEARFDLVRPGVALFGVEPRAGLAPELRQVMRIRSEIVAVRVLEPGEGVGYGHTFRAGRRTTVATVPMGYADGLNRGLSNAGHTLVRGRRAKLVGAVSMDLCAIDVTDVPGARIGDEVVLLGPQEGPLGSDTITATEVAEHTGTIPWEVLTIVSRRVPRFYREP